MSIDDLTLNEIITQSNERTGGNVDLATGRNWCNECSNKFLSPIARLEGYSEIPVVVGTTAYALPSDIQGYNVQLVKQGSTRLDAMSIYDEIVEGAYQLWDGKISIYTPSISSTLKIWYNRKCAAMNAPDDKPDIPNEYRHIYVLYICMLYQQKDEELELEADYQSMFNEAVQIFEQERGKMANRSRRKEWGVRRR